MAVRVKVKNTSEGVRGRLNQVFEPGETKEFTIDSTFEINVLFDAPDLDVEVISVDDPAEIPEAYRHLIAEGAIKDA